MNYLAYDLHHVCILLAAGHKDSALEASFNARARARENVELDYKLKTTVASFVECQSRGEDDSALYK